MVEDKFLEVPRYRGISEKVSEPRFHDEGALLGLFHDVRSDLSQRKSASPQVVEASSEKLGET